MIIIQAAKYFIFDMCIDVFFNRVQSNFKLSSENQIPKINDFFSKITAKDNRETFYSCRILDIYKDGSDIYLDFEYEEYTLNDYDDDEESDDFDSFIPDEEDRVSVEDILAEEDEFWDDDFLGVETIRYSEYMFIR